MGGAGLWGFFVNNRNVCVRCRQSQRFALKRSRRVPALTVLSVRAIFRVWVDKSKILGGGHLTPLGIHLVNGVLNPFDSTKTSVFVSVQERYIRFEFYLI